MLGSHILQTVGSQMAVRLAASRPGRALFPRNFFISAFSNHLCLRLIKPQGVVGPEGLGKLLVIHLIGSGTHNFATCSIML
jgi:hypothetical protein